MREADRPIFGIFCVLGAITCFSIQDTTIKFMSGGYPLYEIVFGRASIALVITLCFLRWEGDWGLLRTKRPFLHLFRALLVIIANMTFFLALASMPIAEAMSIFFVGPLIITVLSVFVLKDKVGPWRWSACIVGFAGVVVMLRPGSEAIEPAAFLPLIAATAYAIMQMTTRKLGETERASTMAFYLQLTFIVVAAGIGLALGQGQFSGGGHPSAEFLLRAWVWPKPFDAGLIFLCGLLNGVGGYLLTQGYRVAQAGFVAPFEYLAIPLVMIWSYLLWSEVPDSVAIIGMIMIVGSGLLVFYRGQAKATEQK